MPENTGRSLLLILAAVFVFACMDSAAKYLASRYPLPLLVWARYTVHFLLMVFFLAPSRRGALLATRRPVAQIMRATLLLGVTSCVITALSTLPLAEATALGYTSPLMAALLAGPWLGEKPRPIHWLTLGIGFLGVLLIARPGGALHGVGVIWSLAGAACYACYQVITRQLNASEDSVTMLFYTALVGTIASSLAFIWLPMPTLPAGTDLLPVLALGALGGLGHFLLIRAFRHASVATLGPFLYAQLIWATLLGWAVFSQLPDSWSLLGMALVVGGGLAVALEQRRRRRC